MTRRKRSSEESKIVVGCRVQTDDSPPKTGVVVEDFGELAGQQVVVDQNTVLQARRWAIQLDDGGLAFCNAESLTVIS
jgi:hypothetical protein